MGGEGTMKNMIGDGIPLEVDAATAIRGWLRIGMGDDDGSIVVTPGWVQTRRGLMNVGETGVVVCTEDGITLQAVGDAGPVTIPWVDVYAFPGDWLESPDARLDRRASEAQGRDVSAWFR